MNGKAWTEKDDKILIERWRGDHSASEIANELGRSRSAILGRVFRLGMSDKLRANRQQKERSRAGKPVKKRVRRSPVPKRVKPIIQTPVDAPEPRNLTMIQLCPDDCRWPVNAPGKVQEYFFCGHPKTDGSSYCEAHKRAAVQVKGGAE